MIVTFRSAKLKKQLASLEASRQAWGERRAKIVQKRLNALRVARVLEDIRLAPGDLHEYRHSSQHLFTMDLDGGWRLYFRSTDDPSPFLGDGVSIDWSGVQSIEILEVSNHGKP